MRERLLAVQELLRPRLPGHGVRWVVPGQLHLTLRFLGSVEAGLAAALCDAMPRLAGAHAAVAAQVAGCLLWPSAKAPRVLVLRLQSQGGLERLAARIEELVVGLGLARESRRFRAHVTLARIAHGCAPVQPLLESPAIALTIDAVALVRSTLRPEGALHEVLRRWPLAIHGGS